MHRVRNRMRFNRSLILLGFCLAWAGLGAIWFDLIGAGWPGEIGQLQDLPRLFFKGAPEPPGVFPAHDSERGMAPIAIPLTGRESAPFIGTSPKQGMEPVPERDQTLLEMTKQQPAANAGVTRNKAVDPPEPGLHLGTTFLPILLTDSMVITVSEPTVLPAPTATPASTPTLVPTPTPSPEIPTHLVIPDILVDAPVLPAVQRIVQVNEVDYQEWMAPDEYAVGWHTTSARLGEPGNTVLNGHHNINGQVFARLVDLNEGAMILVQGENRSFEYQVTEKLILPERDQPVEVRLENSRWIMPTSDERLTLVTCWPLESNTHRLIIVAMRVDP